MSNLPTWKSDILFEIYSDLFHASQAARAINDPHLKEVSRECERILVLIQKIREGRNEG